MLPGHMLWSYPAEKNVWSQMESRIQKSCVQGDLFSSILIVLSGTPEDEEMEEVSVVD